jgi:hypothetical protein
MVTAQAADQESKMSFYIFVAACVLGLDFLIFVLFHWMYADKRQAMAKKLAACRESEKRAAQERLEAQHNKVRQFPSRPHSPLTQARLQKVRARMAGIA